MAPDHKVEITEATAMCPAKVGDLDCSDPKVVRIVHISDTHLRHDQYINDNIIPDGDILVHSGDFTKYCFRKRWDSAHEFHKDVTQLNNFFGRLPHKHKIFVAGNHEITFSYHSPEEIQRVLTNGLYLQDSAVTVEGIQIYGAPWNNYRFWAFSRGFALHDNNMMDKWQQIPDNTDVVVTHNPPRAIMDRSRRKFFQGNCSCTECPDSPHPDLYHWGCPHLRNILLSKVKPMLHLFGHTHAHNGLQRVDSTLFSNAAMDVIPKPKVIDCYFSHH